MAGSTEGITITKEEIIALASQFAADGKKLSSQTGDLEHCRSVLSRIWKDHRGQEFGEVVKKIIKLNDETVASLNGAIKELQSIYERLVDIDRAGKGIGV